MELERSVLWRKGGTAAKWTLVLEPNIDVRDGDQGRRLQITHRMPGNKGGLTISKLEIPPEEFRYLLRWMLVVDRDATIQAIGDAIAEKF